MSDLPLAQAERDLGAVLRHAHAALDDGQAERAREFAQEVLTAARASDDRHMEARALSCLAHCDRLVSRLRRASDASRRAAQLFGSLGDVAGEAMALTTLAHVSTFLGRNDEALEAALLSARLSERLPDGLQAALALNYLGVAQGWSGNFDDAHATLDLAAQTAARCTPPISAYQPRANQAWLEAIRLASERPHMQRPAVLDRLRSMVSALLAMDAAGEMQSLVQGAQVTAKALSALLVGLLHCWRSELDEAAAALEVGREWLGKYPSTTWLNAMGCWVAGEIDCAREDYAQAERLFAQVTKIAGQFEHEQLACLGHLLASQLFTLQERHADAALELRKLRHRERMILAESLKSRARAVDWQLAARQSEQDLLKLEASSKQFERWSLEDALTGIANRRHFERCLAGQLRGAAESGQPVSVALIDVDRFKQVNDEFTHQVGDRVLRTLAGILKAQVREQDLPARLAGDEFVVMLARTDEQAAAQVCQRIRTSVQEFLWESVSPGLNVSVSIGVAESSDGDTVESLLHRSDVSMYGQKQPTARTPETC